jgi:DNA-directed RNA polymerase subunit RPC12/RpoP
MGAMTETDCSEAMMPIEVICSCGKAFSVPDHFAGKAGKCKACGARMIIPESSPFGDAFRFLDDDPPSAPLAPAPLPPRRQPDPPAPIPARPTAPPAAEDDQVRCPQCRSTQLSADKKGFGAGKALIGGVLTGGVGLLAGFIGSKKVMITCLKCGHQWKAGES